MKRRVLTTVIAMVVLTGAVAAPAIVPDRDIERKVALQLKSMTLEEKIGQMCQITLSTLKDRKSKVFKYDETMRDSAIVHYGVGSFLNTPGVAQTPEQWERVIAPLQQMSMEHIGVPTLYGLDQIHGATYTMGATFFPQGINMAASFDTELQRRCAEITAYETRASNVAWSFAPTMDLGRDVRWSRLWESFGEDPLLNAEMGRAMILGFQGDDPNRIGLYNIAACPKHYMGYGVPTTGKDRTPSVITRNELRERYFRPFKAAIEAGALTIMVNSGINDGVPFHANYEMITEWLKEGLEWDGMVVSDWADINNLYTRDRVASSKKDAVRIAINAGIDMSMVPSELSFCRYLRELVEEGEVSQRRIDDAVARILRVKYRLGLDVTPMVKAAEYKKFASEEFAAVALEAAESSQVLVKNWGEILPLKLCEGEKILVTGANANTMRALNGGWSYTWQGEQSDRYAAKHNTIYEALSQKFGGERVTYLPSVEYDKSPRASYDKEVVHDYKAALAASDADYVILCVGENSYCETPGNLTDLNLSAQQKELVRAVAATGKKSVMVITGGRPRIVGDVVGAMMSVIVSMLPSNSGGDALANLIAGDANFSAKLPFTYSREINSLSTYDFKPSESRKKMQGDYNYTAEIDTQWPFGYGLSYTTFEYSDMRVVPDRFTAEDELEVSITLRNSGARDGKEPVLLYSSDLFASVTPDNKRLRSFTKVALRAGESRRVLFTLPASELAFVGQGGKWRLESGDFIISCGDQMVKISCMEDKIWKRANITAVEKK